MRVFFDTNVILDYVLTYVEDRKPFHPDAKALYDEVAAGRIVGLLSATSVTNISHIAEYYLHEELGISPLNSKLGAKYEVEQLLSVFKFSAKGTASAIVPVGNGVCAHAVSSAFDDFEDAVQYHSALWARASHIVTRNGKDYASVASGPIKICSPQEMRAMLCV